MTLSKPLQEDDIALCVCHGVPAWLETDHTPPIWICEVDDVACDVKFKEVKKSGRKNKSD